MFMRSLAAVIGTVLALGAFAQQGPDLPTPEGPDGWASTGRRSIRCTPEEVAEWDISIQPDGEGLPPGSGTASDGAPVYTLHCFSCHGAEGSGQFNDVLVGGHGTLEGPAPRKTVGSFWPYATTVFDYIRRAMPYQQPQSLSDDEVYALTAYLLFLNGIIEEDELMDVADAARSAHAQSRQLHPRLAAPGGRLTLGARGALAGGQDVLLPRLVPCKRGRPALPVPRRDAFTPSRTATCGSRAAARGRRARACIRSQGRADLRIPLLPQRRVPHS